MRESPYPDTPLPFNPKVDVIIPYCEVDKHLVKDALASIVNQQFTHPIIHLVADGCTPLFPPQRIEHATYTLISHVNEKAVGPYITTNYLVPQFTTPYIAIQDADDTSSPSRLWKQIAVLEQFDMTSAAMYQQAMPGYTGTRHYKDPILMPGTKNTPCPGGRCINSTRTMKKSFFIKMGGFANMPCSGDFQFDNRCNLMEPPAAVHYSSEVLGIRRLHPESLSNGGRYKFGSLDRDRVAMRLMTDITTLRKSPTLETARSLGDFPSKGNKALSQPRI